MAKPLARNVLPRLCLLVVSALLVACSSPKLPELRLPSLVPSQWQAPRPSAVASEAAALPHGGSVEQLLDWWRQQGDPVLVELIAASQQVSPSVASAQARLAQARASRVAAAADLAPAVDAMASATRSRSLPSPATPPLNASAAQLGLQASWELDLAGGLRAGREAAEQRLQGARADWHEARVSVAAEDRKSVV